MATSEQALFNRECNRALRKTPSNVEQEIRNYEAYKETQGNEGYHKYCKKCWACEKHINCIAEKKKRYGGLCYKAKMRYLRSKQWGEK